MREKKHREIAVLPGDGIGPEVMKEALKVLRVITQKHNIPCRWTYASIGGEAYDRFGTPLPELTKTICLEADAVLLGSIGGQKWDDLPVEKRPEIGGLLALRKLLKLYANIRPVMVYEDLMDISPLSQLTTRGKIDLVIVRELGAGVYFSPPKALSKDEGLDSMIYRRKDVQRIADFAFRLAARRNKRLISVDKANVLCSSMLWRRVVNEIALKYPDIETRHMYVDNAAMQLILNPQQFDVILTTNLFGDILSDEAAGLCGSLGMLPSASLGETTHLYEPAGGSAPDIAGRSIANPVGMILSMALMLDYSFERPDASQAVFHAVGRVIKSGQRTPDISLAQSQSVKTAQLGSAVCDLLKADSAPCFEDGCN